MSKELTTTTSPGLPGQIEFAKALAAGDMLPAEYRAKPANVLIAMGLGHSMGLSPAESLYRIAVIKGKPTASAELVAANVRRAGHKLRVTVGDDWAEATILRADDPEFPFVVRRDMKWAQGMGLASNDNYKKQGVTMLQWRAITACARLACPEALYGVAYTPDEMAELPDAPSVVTVAEALGGEVIDAEVVDESPASLTPTQKSGIGAQIKRTGISKDDYLALATEASGRIVGGTDELTETEAAKVLESLAQIASPIEIQESSGLAAAMAALHGEQGALA